MSKTYEQINDRISSGKAVVLTLKGSFGCKRRVRTVAAVDGWLLLSSSAETIALPMPYVTAAAATPPPDSGVEALSPEERALVARWIEEGAVYHESVESLLAQSLLDRPVDVGEARFAMLQTLRRIRGVRRPALGVRFPIANHPLLVSGAQTPLP